MISSMPTNQQIEIMLIEDNPGDVDLTKAALRRCKVTNHLMVALDGETGLAMLRREGAYAETPCPDVIFLDLNLPGLSGVEVLKEIKSDPELRRIPVVIMTSSRAEADIVRTYDLHANSYVNKPLDLDEFRKVVSSIEQFWFTIVKLPTKVTVN